MSLPARTRAKHACAVSHSVPRVVTPGICAAIAADAVLFAISAARALTTTASYDSPAYR
jgi:hypothetical protein